MGMRLAALLALAAFAVIAPVAARSSAMSFNSAEGVQDCSHGTALATSIQAALAHNSELLDDGSAR